MRELLERFVAVNLGRSLKTQGTNDSIIQKILKTWPGGIDIEVRHVRPSHLDEWLALHEARLKNTSYNRYAGLVKQLFEIAVKDRIIAESPFEQVTTRWKKPQEPIRCVPTIQQFQAIVDEIRAQRYTRFAAPTADFVEFLGLAGVGQAEAASLTWGDVANPPGGFFDVGTSGDKFAEKASKKLDERESILQGKHTPGPAELMVTREINFHKAFLAGIAIIASVLFAIVWARFK